MAIQSEKITQTGVDNAMGIPSMTTAQRDAIASPLVGNTVYNSTTSALNVYNGTAWVAVGGGGGATPIEDEGSVVVASPTAINFVGAGVNASDSSGVATITIPGASSTAGVAFKSTNTNTSISTTIEWNNAGTAGAYADGPFGVTVSGQQITLPQSNLIWNVECIIYSAAVLVGTYALTNASSGVYTNSNTSPAGGYVAVITTRLTSAFTSLALRATKLTGGTDTIIGAHITVRAS